MLLFIPIRTDSPVRRLPRVNFVLIALNTAMFLIANVFSDSSSGATDDGLRQQFMLTADHPAVYQFLTYQFLHADIWHLFGNMLFLWVFGNSVNSKMGNWAYLMFYLACGIFAGAAFAWFSDSRLLGASGAVAGVTTAFLLLFPGSEVTTFYWLFLYVGTMPVKALLLIGLKVILWDNILSPNLASDPEALPVAHSAHLAGYAFGSAVCGIMLLVRALPRDQYDAIALVKRWHRRQQSREVLADPDARAAAMYGRVARPVSARPLQSIEAPINTEMDAITRLRAEIAGLIEDHDYTAAADRYQALVAEDPAQCLPRRNMLVVANQLMTLNRHPQAAAAYERFLKAYPDDADLGRVRLVLGIIYAKYLQQPETAQRHLRECIARISDPDQQRQAEQWLAILASAGSDQTDT